jgi:hypothetical protein
MLEFLRAYAALLLLGVGLLMLLMLWRCAALLTELCDGNRRLLPYLSHVDAARKQDFESHMERVFLRLEALEGQASYSGYQVHLLAAHFVPRLRTKQDVSADYYHAEEAQHGLDAESEFHRELAESQESRSEAPRGLKALKRALRKDSTEP